MKIAKTCLFIMLLGFLAGCDRMPGIYGKLACGGVPLTSEGWEYFDLDFKFNFPDNSFDAGLIGKMPGRSEVTLEEKFYLNDHFSVNLRDKIILFAHNLRNQVWSAKTYKEDRQREFDGILADINSYLAPHRAQICGGCAVAGGCMPKIELDLDRVDIGIRHYNSKETVYLRQKNAPKGVDAQKDQPFLKVSCTPCADAKCLVDPVIGDAGR
jgi:hypothetical protein